MPSSRHPMAQRTFRHYYDPDALPSTPVPGASVGAWILPRANKVSPGHFVTPVCALVPPFRVPWLIKKFQTPQWGIWNFGTPEGTRTPNPRNRKPVKILGSLRKTGFCHQFCNQIMTNPSLVFSFKISEALTFFLFLRWAYTLRIISSSAWPIRFAASFSSMPASYRIVA